MKTTPSTTPLSQASQNDISKIWKDKDLMNYIKESNGYMDDIQEKMNNHIEKLDQKIARIETLSKVPVKIYQYYSTELKMLYDIGEDILPKDFYQKLEEIVIKEIGNEKEIDESQYMKLQIETEELKSKIEDLGNMINQAPNKTIKEQLEKKQKDTDIALNQKNDEMKKIIDTSAIEKFLSEEKIKLQTEKETKKKDIESLKDTLKRFSNLIDYLEERAKRPENEKYFEEIKEKVITIDKDINKQKELLNTYQNDPEMTELIQSMINGFEEQRSIINSSSSKDLLEKITKNLGEETLENLKLTDVISITIKKKFGIALHNAETEEIGNEWINIKNESGETYCFNKKENKVIEGNYKNEDEAEIANNLYKEHKRIEGALTIKDSEIPEYKNITTKEGEEYHINLKDKRLYKGSANIIEKTDDKIFYHAEEKIYCNNIVIKNNVKSITKIQDTPYYIMTDGNERIRIFDINNYDTIGTKNIGGYEYIEPNKLSKENYKIYEKLKQHFNVITIKNRLRKDELWRIDKENKKLFHIGECIGNEASSPLFKIKDIESEYDSYILNIDEEEKLEFNGEPIKLNEYNYTIKKIGENLNICISKKNGTNLIIAGNKLVGGWNNYDSQLKNYKVYETKNSDTIIIFNYSYESGTIYIIDKNAPLGEFKELKNCYSTPHEDYYIVKENSMSFYVFDAKNNEKISENYQKYDKISDELSTPKKGIFSPEKKIKITSNGIEKLK